MNTGKPRVAKKNIKRFQRALRAAGCYVDLINDGGEICLSLKRTADDVMLVTLGVVAEYKAEKGEVVFACTITKNEEGENG